MKLHHRRIRCGKPLALVSAGALLASCATRPLGNTDEPARDLAPATWSQPSGQLSVPFWIAALDSAKLSALVDEAMENNFGLESARQRVRAAEAAARITNAQRLPSIGAGGRASKSRSFASFEPPVALEGERHSLSLSAQWEVDLWNRLGLAYQASRAQYQASQYDFEALRLSLASQVAKAWFNAISAQRQFELATASAESFESNLETLERRYERGIVDAFDVRLIRAQASSSRANAIQRRNQMDTAIRTLEFLLGRYPSADIAAAGDLPELQETPLAGLPSDVLAHRPDIAAERNRLVAALALEHAANRNWLPSLVLTGSDGTVSDEFSNLLDSDFNVWSLAADVSMALFQGGRLKAQRDQLNANQLSQLSQYKQTVLQAFREVESALRSEVDLKALEAQTRIAATQNREAEAQAWSLYERGLVDIISVLDAERRSFDSRSQLISIRNQRLQNRINLHVALGDAP